MEIKDIEKLEEIIRKEMEKVTLTHLPQIAQAIPDAGYIHESEVFTTVKQIEDAGYIKREVVQPCPHVYESDCHGIEMIKSPSGREFAIGGTNHKDRWLYDPWCGQAIKTVAEKIAEGE